MLDLKFIMKLLLKRLKDWSPCCEPSSLPVTSPYQTFISAVLQPRAWWGRSLQVSYCAVTHSSWPQNCFCGAGYSVSLQVRQDVPMVLSRERALGAHCPLGSH